MGWLIWNENLTPEVTEIHDRTREAQRRPSHDRMKAILRDVLTLSLSRMPTLLKTTRSPQSEPFLGRTVTRGAPVNDTFREARQV